MSIPLVLFLFVLVLILTLSISISIHQMELMVQCYMIYDGVKVMLSAKTKVVNLHVNHAETFLINILLLDVLEFC